MSSTRNSQEDNNSNVIDELNKYKQSLTIALKRQAELEKQLKSEKLNQIKDKKNHSEERTRLLNRIGELNYKTERLTAYSEQLELELIKKNEQIKNLTDALQQSQQTLSATLENKTSSSSSAETDKATLTVTEPVPEVVAPKTAESTETTTATAGPSSYSMFSPWRILGYTDAKSTPTPENPAHTSLADLTKASVEQALAENNALPSMHK